MGKIEALLKRLPHMDAVQLREEWFLLFYRDVSSSMSSKLMRLALAHRIQELEHEAEDRCTAIRKKAASLPRTRERAGHGHAQRMTPGTRLLREYDGKVHEVLVVENGRFVYAGQVCHSLSEVARKITGTPRSGRVFFGLKDRGSDGADA